MLREYFIGWNRTLKLETEASTESGSVAAYQWYAVPRKQLSYDDTALTFPDSCAIQDATSSSYTPPVISADTVITYVCAVTDSNGDTAAAAFILNPAISRDVAYPQNGPNGVIVKNIYAFSIGQGYEYRDPLLSSDVVHSGDEELSSATKFLISRRTPDTDWKNLEVIDGKGPQGPQIDWSDRADFYVTYTDTTAKMGEVYIYKYRSYVNKAWVPSYYFSSVEFNPFFDISMEDERAQYIAWAYNNDVIKGSLDDSGHRLFKPDDPCTRMNFVMILWKMHGKPAVSGKNPFSDVSGSTSVKAVKWAVKKKLVTGTSATKFSPDDNLSRINIIMILYKLAGSPKVSAESPYEDISGSKTSKAVNWAVGKEIISPVDETHFAPDDNCSRALLVEILCKYNEIYKIL